MTFRNYMKDETLTETTDTTRLLKLANSILKGTNMLKDELKKQRQDKDNLVDEIEVELLQRLDDYKRILKWHLEVY